VYTGCDKGRVGKAILGVYVQTIGRLHDGVILLPLPECFANFLQIFALHNNNNGSSYIAHFTNVPMRFTISGGLFRAAYYGTIGSQEAYNHER
jgi:hypothetical protein